MIQEHPNFNHYPKKTVAFNIKLSSQPHGPKIKLLSEGMDAIC